MIPLEEADVKNYDFNLRHTEVSSGRTARDHGCHP